MSAIQSMVSQALAARPDRPAKPPHARLTAKERCEVELLAAQGLSQYQIAARLRVPRPTVQKILNKAKA